MVPLTGQIPYKTCVCRASLEHVARNEAGAFEQTRQPRHLGIGKPSEFAELVVADPAPFTYQAEQPAQAVYIIAGELPGEVLPQPDFGTGTRRDYAAEPD